jgi:hypothetical protein
LLINHKFKKITSLLSEHTLLALDYDRCSLIIIPLGKSNAEYIKEIKLNSKPWGVTKVSDYKIAVTFPNEGKIRQITFSDDMEVLDTTDIPGHGRCFDIAYSNNHFVVSYFNGFTGCIKIVSISGIKVKLFALDDNGWDLFIKPYYLIVSPDNTMIYVSDMRRHTVTCLTFDGEVAAIYIDDQLKAPHQLAVDEYGSVYVCGYDSNNVHQLSHYLTKVKILDKSHGIDTPTSIAYCQNTKKLFVGMNQSSKIKVFNVSLD